MCQHHRDCGEKTLNELEEPGRGQFSHFSLCPGGSSFLISSSCQSCRPYYQQKSIPNSMTLLWQILKAFQVFIKSSTTQGREHTFLKHLPSSFFLAISVLVEVIEKPIMAAPFSSLLKFWKGYYSPKASSIFIEAARLRKKGDVCVCNLPMYTSHVIFTQRFRLENLYLINL